MESILRGLLIVLLLVGATVVEAGVVREDKGDEDWEFLIAPYLWGVNIKGSSRVGLLPEMDVDAEFSDILDNLNGGLSLHMELHRGNWGFVLDPTYLNLEMDASTPGSLAEPTAEAKIWLVEGLGLYKITPNWELLAGFRWQEQDLEVDPGFPDPFPSDSFGIKEDWVDWIIGARFNYPLWGSKWLASGKGDVAIAGDSETNYNLQIFINRRIGKTMLFNFGYRYMETDYDEFPSFVWDVRQQGLIVGYTWSL